MEGIAERLGRVRERIALAATRAGRSPSEITIVGASKGVPARTIAEAAALGIVDFGENRAQELVAKMEALGPRAADLRWHFLGVLQRNKVRSVVGRVLMVHSVNSEDLARAIATRALAEGMRQDVLLEVNVAGERTKSGVAPEDAVRTAERVAALPGVRLKGLMTVEPAASPEEVRPVFATLRALGARVREVAPEAGELSMGMSADYEVAVEEGATMVRIGEALFGSRPLQPPSLRRSGGRMP